ncbi:hypothetical protein GCM10027414_14140 [Humibacter ginsengiterrae]
MNSLKCGRAAETVPGEVVDAMLTGPAVGSRYQIVASCALPPDPGSPTPMLSCGAMRNWVIGAPVAASNAWNW